MNSFRKRTAYALVCSLTACSLTTSLDGLTGGADHGPAGDSGTDGAPSTSDASPTPDAATGQDGGDAKQGDAGSCAANPSSDPANCGRCGHDCLGGKCQAGLCQPVTVADKLSEVFFAALSVSDVFWVNGDGAIARAPKDGGAASIFAVPGPYQVPIVVDGTNVYVPAGAADGGVIDRLALAGGPPATLVTGANPVNFALRDGILYWTDKAAGAGAGTVKMAPVALPNMVTILASGQTDPEGIAVSSTTVFWTDAQDGLILSCPIAGCSAPQTIASGQNYPVTVAADETNVYWAEETSPNAIKSCAHGGCVSAPNVLTHGASIASLVATPDALYWVNSVADGTIETCSLSGVDGGPGTIIAAGQNRPHAIVTDALAVYWTTRGTEGLADATIMKVAR